ncbi:MAG: T9SS type A sorting domain-containing protein [Ignavibacteriaceae bacterium]|nr:T9SS type A sorting domain-containing protein [Ignavibacteriaceae bacterium]
MKNLTTLFFALLMLTSTGSLFAQGVSGDEAIWSVPQIDRNSPNKIELPNDWVPADPIIKYYDLGTGITVSPNFRPKPGTNTTQSEMSIDVHPTNNNIVFGSANATNYPVTTLYGTGVYWSLDGATNWTGFDNPPFGTNSGDPVSVIGADGRFYENFITNAYGQGVATSTNNGANWSSYTIAPNPGSVADKNHFMVDKHTTSPYLNRAYCVWTDFGGTNNYRAVLRLSTNFGQTWSASSINLSSALGGYLHQGANVQTGPNGEVYVAFAVYVDGSVSTGEDGIGFVKSTDGGATWSTPIYAYQATNFGIRGTLSSKSGIRVASFPSMAVDRSGGPRNGWIYITWPQRGVSPAGSDPDIVMITSTNGGANWSTPVRVNDDALNNGKDQYYSWCTVDQATGQLMLVFYDSRNVPNSQAEVYMARSLDGGTTFENFKVSDQPHTPAPIPGLAGGYAGDYIGVAALGDVAYPFWADNRTGNYQGWGAVVTFGPPCPIDPPSNPSPANGATGLPLTGNTATWTNGVGASQIEVWFGQGSNLNMVYSGAPITSLSLAPFEPLTYNTSYSWQIKGKNDTCTVPGPIWTFTTMQDPNLFQWCEEFTNLNNWTIVGPAGLTNWSAASSSNAGGTPPELRFSWTPSFTGVSKIRSSVINLPNNQPVNYSFKFYLDWYANPSGIITIGITYDGGTTSIPLYTETNPTGNIGPTTVTGSFTTPVSGNSNLQLEITYDGYSFNLDYVYWDDFCLEYVVPVELTSFTALSNGADVELNWTTATETNNQGFEIQRMNAGGSFEQVGYVAGFGTTTEPKAYSFIDSKLSEGNYTYRLKQIDFDGTFTYSDAVNVEVEIPLEYALEQNYPNPFNPSTTIKYSIPEDGFVKLAVYNMLGEEVATIVNATQKAGRYEMNFDASGLSSGVYVYRIEAANYTASKKLMLMK